MGAETTGGRGIGVLRSGASGFWGDGRAGRYTSAIVEVQRSIRKNSQLHPPSFVILNRTREEGRLLPSRVNRGNFPDGYVVRSISQPEPSPRRLFEETDALQPGEAVGVLFVQGELAETLRFINDGEVGDVNFADVFAEGMASFGGQIAIASGIRDMVRRGYVPYVPEPDPTGKENRSPEAIWYEAYSEPLRQDGLQIGDNTSRAIVQYLISRETSVLRQDRIPAGMDSDAYKDAITQGIEEAGVLYQTASTLFASGSFDGNDSPFSPSVTVI